MLSVARQIAGNNLISLRDKKNRRKTDMKNEDAFKRSEYLWITDPFKMDVQCVLCTGDECITATCVHEFYVIRLRSQDD